MTVPEWEALSPFQKELLKELRDLRHLFEKLNEELES